MPMSPEELKRKVDTAIVCADQLVFTYIKDDGTLETRFATPISIELKAGANTMNPVPLDDLMVLTQQHLPEDGYRKFCMGKMQSVIRVISRAS